MEEDLLYSYMNFLNNSKTEREAAKNIKELLDNNGFKDFNEVTEVKKGDKIYFYNKNKSIFAAIIGEEPLYNGMNIIGSHIDSPRLDLRPNPLYNKDTLNMFKTHYYGGIKKYQWVTIPLSMHGICKDTNGNIINISIGEDENDPIFVISDLLPHLAQNQMEKKLKEGISGEDLNILVGNSGGNISKIIEEKYGINTKEFMVSEIEFVPSFKARFAGFDKKVICAYGQDDKSCAYASLKALLSIDSNNLKHTAVCMFLDKEEIGSEGNTGMKSNIFDYFLNELMNKKQENFIGGALKSYMNSKMLSADVNGAYDPNFDDVFEKNNAGYLGKGINFCKYTGSRGKSSASDANAEYLMSLKEKLDNTDIKYQFTEMGKIDIGGGGTISFILADKGVEVVDCGFPVLSMHSPYEMLSTDDFINGFKTYKMFLEL